MRSYAPSPTVAAPRVPLYQMGFLDAEKRRQSHGRMYSPSPTLRAPRTPLHQLGWAGLGDTTSSAIVAGSQVGSKVATGWLTSTGLMSTSLVPIVGTAIAVVGAVIAGLWAAHSARAKGAKTENAAVSSALSAFDQAMKAIFAAVNASDPAQNISASQAIQLVEQQYSQFWAGVAPYTKGPGRADASSLGSNCGGPTNMSAPCSGMPNGHKCDKSCTVSCCVGCQDIKPVIDQAIAVLQAGGGTVQVCNVAGDKYGLAGRGSYTLTYKAPTLSQTASGLLADLTGGSGGGSMLPLLALAAVAFFALR